MSRQKRPEIFTELKFSFDDIDRFHPGLYFHLITDFIAVLYTRRMDFLDFFFFSAGRVPEVYYRSVTAT